MGIVRLAAVNLVLVILIGGSLYDVVTNQEHWPLSPYPMYADRSDHRLTLLSVFGVSAVDGTERSLMHRKYLHPLDRPRLRAGLSRISRGPGGARRMERALAAVLRRYEELRVRGSHEGDPLEEIRLYRTTRRLMPGSRAPSRLVERELIASVSGSSGQ